MADNLDLVLRMRADMQQATREIRGMRRDIDRLGKDGKKSGSDASRGIDRIESSAKRANASVSGLYRQVAGLASALGTIHLGRGIINASVEFQKINASLKTVTGSQEAASAEFARLLDFASKTPFQLQEVLGAFVKLKALGLDPSNAALRSYGNTASAMGKSLDQLIEAVADAATGEFERLKEFGIKASQQGDQVTFTFRNVSTTVQKSAADITAYLQNIGNTDFASGMSDQMDTLGGKFSNLDDAIFKLQISLGESGFIDVVTTVVEELTSLASAMGDAGEEAQNSRDPFDGLREFMRITAFTVFKLKQEFSDLGDVIGYTGAVISTVLQQEIGFGMLDELSAKLDAMAERRKAVREQIEKESEQFVSTLEGINSAGKAFPDERGKGAADGRIESNASTPAPSPTVSKDFTNAANDLARRIGLLGRETTEQRMLWEVEKGRYADLKKEEKTALVALARRLDTLKAESKAQQDAAKASVDAQQKAAEEEKRLKDQLRSIVDSVDPAAPLIRQLELIEELRKRWPRYADALDEAALRVHEQIDQINSDVVDTGDNMDQFAVEAARNIQDAFANFLFDPFDQSLRGMLAGFIDVLRRMASEALAAQLADKLFGKGFASGKSGSDIGGLFGSGLNFISGLFHDGGIVGLPSATRNVSPLLFAGAPRYHSGGLAADEMPAILRKGEEVLTADDPRHVRNGGAAAGGGSNGVRIVNVIDPALVQDYMTSSAGEDTILNVLSRRRSDVQSIVR